MSKSNKSTPVLSSSSVGDRAMNLGEDYEDASFIEVTDEGSTIMDHRSSIPSLIELILGKWIA
jgi:hypothetical protein